ncbi:MAG: RagB/SusD family nutrient uptake outer membrane protein [Dysgonamonadaceae bacterium]|jgi:hypothetical protein|nr:RagB/SusD family nutrient uptake outer membrane protein [Dysgonamonadaceae bacterium]
MKKIKILLFAAILTGLTACSDWLDVVPDGVATLDMAFNSRAQAIKYLATCYSYQPKNGGSGDPATLGGDEIWTRKTDHLSIRFSTAGLDIANGMQNATSPVLPRWNDMYNGLRVCNTFLENVNSVPDLDAWEREQWAAEATVLKAYYHFALVQMYGPVPLIRENMPVDADVYTVKVDRRPVDECFDYIVELLDEATKGDKLPSFVLDPASDYGRITKPIALALKAKVLVTAASPLFNGNNDQATLKNHDGTPLFNSTYDPEKWVAAMDACKEAIDVCHEAGFELYEYENPGNRYGDTIALNITLRNAFNLRNNIEVIWANTQMISIPSYGGMINVSMPKLNPDYVNSGEICKFLGMPIKIAEMFYSEHGVPLDEDKYRDVGDLYTLRTAEQKDELYIKKDKVTIDMHFDREPRFYAWVGFDRGIWFGAGQYNDKDASSLRWLGFKVGETDGTEGQGTWTGYIPKKYIPYEAMLNGINSISSPSYAWPVMRLSDLYLLYAEAINEAEGPNGFNSSKMFQYIDMVRARAGLKGVKESWDTYTDNQKYNTQAGMREIIQKERLIELSFEGQRFWDIRRWKTAPKEYSTPLKGWDMLVAATDGTEEQTSQMMYQPQLLLEQKFGIRDYFWPIKTSDIEVNPNLVQNIGW